MYVFAYTEHGVCALCYYSIKRAYDKEKLCIFTMGVKKLQKELLGNMHILLNFFTEDRQIIRIIREEELLWDHRKC